MGACRGRSGAGAQQGQGCGLPAAAGARVQPFGSTGDGRAPAPGTSCKMDLAGAEEQRAKMR